MKVKKKVHILIPCLREMEDLNHIINTRKIYKQNELLNKKFWYFENQKKLKSNPKYLFVPSIIKVNPGSCEIENKKSLNKIFQQNISYSQSCAYNPMNNIIKRNILSRIKVIQEKFEKTNLILDKSDSMGNFPLNILKTVKN